VNSAAVPIILSPRSRLSQACTTYPLSRTAAVTLVGSFLGLSVLRSTVPTRLTAVASMRTGLAELVWALLAG